MRRVDHIAYAVPDLAAACQQLEGILGCQVIMGGRHLNNGTHNALVNLGNEIYLELIATDHKNKEITGPRWMGVDLIKKPTVTRWALKSPILKNDLKALNQYNPDLGNSFEGSRKKHDGSTLNWHMALPLHSPEVELAPFAVDWKDSVHPTKSLPDECKLLEIEFMHPNPVLLNDLFNKLDLEYNIQTGNEAEIKLKISSPNGIVELS